MDWSDAENMQPLKTGRRFQDAVPVENSALPKAALAEADAKRTEFLKEINEYSGNDPLPLWVRLIRWINDTYKSGSHSQLVPILERCTREMKTIDRYRDDIRYLRIWIQYADSVQEPQDIFTWLEQHEVGHGHALLYLAHASWLERRGAHTAAKAAYELGISRNAAPLNTLHLQYQEFQHRMRVRLQERREERRARGEEAPSAAVADENGGRPPRATFAELSTRRPRDGSRPALSSRPLTALSGIKRRPNGPASAAANADAGPLDVYVDEEFGGVGSGPAYSAPRTRLEAVPTLDAGRKENAMVPTSLHAGGRMPVRRAAAPALAPTLEIPTDDEFLTAEPEHRPPTSQVSVRRHLDASSAGAQAILDHNPLRLHSLVEGGSAASRPQPGQTAASQKRPKVANPVLMFDAEVLATPDGIELCFEELRAEHMRRMAVPLDAATGSGGCEAPTAAPVLEAAPAAPQPAASLVSTPRQNDTVVPQSPEATAAVPANTSARQAPSEGARTAVRELAAGATRGEEVPPPASVQPSTTVPPALEPAPTAAPTPVAASTPQNLPAVLLTAVRGDSGRWDAENLAPAGLTPAVSTEVVQCEGSTPIKAPSTGKSSVRPRTGLRPRTPNAPTGPVTLAEQSPLPAPGLSGSPQVRAEAASPAGSLPASPPRLAGDDTTSFDLFGGAFSGALPEPGVSGLEPTITINTLEAYSAMNDMFNGTLPHEAARPVSRPAIPLPPRRPSLGGNKRRSGLFAPRSSGRASVLPPYATQPLPALHETEQDARDSAMTSVLGGQRHTGAHAGPAAASGDQTGELGMYEDTQFLGGLGAPLAAAAADDDGALLVREDTMFLGSGNDSALGIREDTQFLQPAAPRPPSTGGLGGGSNLEELLVREDTMFLGSSNDDTLGIREDTQFHLPGVQQPPQLSAMPPPAPRCPSVAARPTTSAPRSPPAASENVPPTAGEYGSAAAVRPAQPAASLPASTPFTQPPSFPDAEQPPHMWTNDGASVPEGPFDPQQENLTPAGGTAQRDPKPPRSLSAALQPLSIETAGARGVDIGTGYASDDEPGPVAARVPPAVTLAQAGSDIQDDFIVFSDAACPDV